MLRLLLWRALALAGLASGLLLALALLHGAPGVALRTGHAPDLRAAPPHGPATVAKAAAAALHGAGARGGPAIAAATLLLLVTAWARLRSRRRRRYERMRVVAYRADREDPVALARALTTLHLSASAPPWRRLIRGQDSIALEVHHGTGDPDGPPQGWLCVSCPRGLVPGVEAALRGAYPNLRIETADDRRELPGGVLLRLRKHGAFIRRTATAEQRLREERPAVDRLLAAMAGCPGHTLVQFALTPAPASLERAARRVFVHHELRLQRDRAERGGRGGPSLVEQAELRGGLQVQHSSLFFADIRILARRRADCERIAAVLRAQRAENRLVRTATRPGPLTARYARRVQRGEGNPLPGLLRGVFAPAELAELWQLPSVDYAAVPFARSPLPLAPAPPDVERPRRGRGTLRDALGPVSIHVELRRQNTAVPGTVEQGKSSFLVASVAEDLLRERCAVIVLDPKGDAADAAISAVPPERRCTLLDLAAPTCGFNPLAVDAPADVIADYVVGALKVLYSDADIRASSDRYLRNAIIAVLSADRTSTLWDAARLLSVGEEGYAYRRAIGARVRELPELKEISSFFTDELAAQLADARSSTTAKLDAPVNKLARLLNSPSIKRVLLNDSLRIDLDRVIAGGEVLIVKGALGVLGAGNTSVLMQLLVGMLDAALARQQDLVAPEQRTAVALKVDEAPLVLNRGFAETMALKRSAGLETVACWQTDSQWVEREVRDQLDALFAHRVYFATASASDARAGSSLTMAQFSDTVRPGVGHLGALGHPDARLRLPRHHAIASWTTLQGRQAAFLARTLPMRVDRQRIALHAEAQQRRGASPLIDLRQPHWQRERLVTSTAATPRPATSPERAELPALPPGPAAVGFRELLELDHAVRVRPGARPERVRPLSPEPLDVEMLQLIATFGHLLSSQIHRHLCAERAPSTTQRRLKRLADAGLVERFQLHRRDGGGVPMCYRVSPAGRWALDDDGAATLDASDRPDVRPSPRHREAPGAWLRQVRHELHAAGWALALAAASRATRVHGGADSMLAPPRAAGGGVLSPASLKLAHGHTPHGFLRSDGSGARSEAQRFHPVRPDARVVLAMAGGGELDVLLELDDRVAGEGWAGKVERYDHFLTGWSQLLARYAPGTRAEAMVVFACRDRRRAHQAARRADRLLSACRAYPGEYPAAWQRTGRERMLFVAERDVHEGLLCGWRVPPLPPELRDPPGEEDEQQPAAIAGELPVCATPRPEAATVVPAG